jgi:putative ABC transport system substrate-binding protein
MIAPSTVPLVRRGIVLAVVLVAAALGACGNDHSPNRTIAFLRASPVPEANTKAFLDELAASGWKEGDNLTVLARSSDEAYSDPADKLAEWKEHGVDLVVALSTPSAMAADAALEGVPILFGVNDPIGSGLVADARKPEGQMSGVSFRVPPDRTLDIVQSLPSVRTVGLLWPSEDAAAKPVRAGLEEAARQLRVKLVEESFVDEGDVSDAVDRLVADGVDAIVLAASVTTVNAFDAIERATTPTKLPVIANNTACTFAAIVLSPESPEVYRQLARQANRVLKGTPIAGIPVEDPGSFVLTIRQDVMRRIGMTVPKELLDRAELTG